MKKTITPLPVSYASKSRPWVKIIIYLVVRDFDIRFRKHNWVASVFLFLEPLILITLISSLRLYLYGKIPLFGTSQYLFIAAGVFPFYVFRNSSNGVKPAKARTAEYYFVKSFDYLISHFLIQQIHIYALLIIYFSILWLTGVSEAAPHAPLNCIAALLLLGVLALGVGLMNAAIRSHIEGWSVFYIIVSRPIMMFSGAFVTVDYVPEPARSVFTWNPISHAIELFRLGLYPNYPVASLDTLYLVKCTVVMLFLGIIFYNNRYIG